MFRWPLASIALASAAALAQPAPEPRFNQVDLQASAQTEIVNDTLNASLYVEMNDADPAKLADGINRRINAGLAQAKQYPTVRVRTGFNQTFPVYDKSQRLTGWRGRAEIRLQSKDFEKAAALIGKMQSGMQVGSIAFSVSPEARKAAEDRLIAEGIASFRARAEIVKTALGGKAYKLRHMNINGGQFQPLATRAFAPAAEVAPQALEGGVSNISVNVSGTIEVE